MLAFVFPVLIKVIFRERDVLFVQLMNPTILCGQMEMQAFQLAYVSISPLSGKQLSKAEILCGVISD